MSISLKCKWFLILFSDSFTKSIATCHVPDSLLICSHRCHIWHSGSRWAAVCRVYESLHHGLAHCTLCANFNLLPIFVNKVLLEHRGMPIHLRIFCGYFHIAVGELNCYDRSKALTSELWWKKTLCAPEQKRMIMKGIWQQQQKQSRFHAQNYKYSVAP